MKTRSHKHEIELAAPPEKVFSLLHTPSSIRAWWGASQAMVVPQEGGLWAATWGSEDDPDHVSAYKIRVFAPPRLLVLADAYYYAKTGPLPFKAKFLIAFTVEPHPQGSLLRVEQDGFPKDAAAHAFYAACEKGWRDTFEAVRKYVASGFKAA